ncbi:MAG: peptidylprolyl isomerase [Gammaproteobacteria bacterium]|nr:peptidylprolyl isomerase [Gammaproteobacteria bacterium]
MDRQITMRWPREPLVYFLLAGALLFIFSGIVDPTDEDYRIELTDANLTRMADQWQAQMGRSPSADELKGLTEQWIKEEIFYREAMRLSLDDNDVIIRRRLVQKLTFLTEDMATSVSATSKELQAFYEDNLERYTEPDRYSFSHRYFSSERRENAEADARAALVDEQVQGDPFMLQRSYAERSLREIGDLFGREFAEGIENMAQLQIAERVEPIRSAYGWHVVDLQHYLPSTSREFDEVLNKVANDVQMERRGEANKTFYEDLKQRYVILTP